MWHIIKIDKKKIQFLKEDFKKKIGNDIIFYNPKFLVQKYKKKQITFKRI